MANSWMVTLAGASHFQRDVQRVFEGELLRKIPEEQIR